MAHAGDGSFDSPTLSGTRSDDERGRDDDGERG